MSDLNNIKEGQRITFNYYGKIYTKKVKDAFSKGYTKAYNVNAIGSGTQYVCVDQEDVISVK
jgi:hypothetical protein